MHLEIEKLTPEMRAELISVVLTDVYLHSNEDEPLPFIQDTSLPSSFEIVSDEEE